MKPLRFFSEYIADGIVKKQSPDIPRSESLVKEAEISYSVLMEHVEKLGISDRNANHIVKNSYDIIMESVRSKMLLNGFGSAGTGAHEAEVAYLRELGFNQADIEFTNQLRYFRNGITYYGKSFDAEYAKKVVEFLKRMYTLLREQKMVF